MEVLRFRWVSKRTRVVIADVLPCRHQEPTRPARGVTDRVIWLRGGHLDHQLDDVPRRSELAVLPRGRDLGEHVLVDIALGVSIHHWDRVEPVHRLLKQRRSGNGETGPAHVLGMGGGLHRWLQLIGHDGR